MKAKILLGCVALQVLILGFMAGQREWVRRTGRVVYLRTAPVDPRDAMRGDYVRLNYDFSRVPRELWRGSLPRGVSNFAGMPRDTRVYAALQLQEDGVAELVSLGLDQPRGGIYLQGRTESSMPNQINVRYGLEAMFVEQGRGTELEAGRDRNGIQVPLEMKTAVGPSGIAVLLDHRKCALGIGLNFEMTNSLAAHGQQRRRPAAATVQLLNASSNDLAVVDLPAGHGMRLVTDSTWTENPWRWTPQLTNAPENASLIVLKPGQTHSFRISFDDPWWSVSKTGKPEQTKLLCALDQEWNDRFRFEYRAPLHAVPNNLPNADLLWHGRILSRAFNPTGGID